MKKANGFTLIEMMVVVSIIAILALMAMPKPDSAIARRQVVESIELIEDYKKAVDFYYKKHSLFFKNNKEANIPVPEKLLGNYIDSIELKEGAFHLHFGNKAHASIKGKTLSLQPLIVKGSPESPMSWLCGNSAIPENMQAIGENRTNLELKDLPIHCRI